MFSDGAPRRAWAALQHREIVAVVEDRNRDGHLFHILLVFCSHVYCAWRRGAMKWNLQFLRPASNHWTSSDRANAAARGMAAPPTLGFYTMPVMTYPAIAVWTWCASPAQS